jgi:hypothetical protein
MAMGMGDDVSCETRLVCPLVIVVARSGGLGTADEMLGLLVCFESISSICVVLSTLLFVAVFTSIFDTSEAELLLRIEEEEAEF